MLTYNTNRYIIRSINERKRKEDVTMKENYKRFDVVLVDFGQVEFA